MVSKLLKCDMNTENIVKNNTQKAVCLWGISSKHVNKLTNRAVAALLADCSEAQSSGISRRRNVIHMVVIKTRAVEHRLYICMLSIQLLNFLRSSSRQNAWSAIPTFKLFYLVALCNTFSLIFKDLNSIQCCNVTTQSMPNNQLNKLITFFFKTFVLLLRFLPDKAMNLLWWKYKSKWDQRTWKNNPDSITAEGDIRADKSLQLYSRALTKKQKWNRKIDERKEWKRFVS